DSNTNAVPDFYEVSLAVPSTITGGDYATDTDDGQVQATWSRAAGSKTGTCRLVLTSSQFGTLPDFSASFQVEQYPGTLRYTPGPHIVPATLDLSQADRSSNNLGGLITFSKVPTNTSNELDFGPSKVNNALGQRLLFMAGQR